MNDLANHPSRSILTFPAERPFVTALLGSVLLWVSFAPVACWPLAWVATIPWISLVAVEHVTAKRFWSKLWLAGLIYWLATLYFVPLPHPALWLGWMVLASVLSIYPLLFVWISRQMVHDHRVPLVFATPGGVCCNGVVARSPVYWLWTSHVGQFSVRDGSHHSNLQLLRRVWIELCDGSVCQPIVANDSGNFIAHQGASDLGRDCRAQFAVPVFFSHASVR